MATVAERFAALFAGLDRAYGIYIVPPPGAAGAKRAGEARTVQAPVNAALWERHLAGEVQIGLVPIRDDATCVFGAIDVDDYSTDHPALGKKIKKLKLPLVQCRSKSGGAHLYCFASIAVAAVRLRELLAGWAASLGYASVELFPKQDALHSPKDTGNWINMPYSGGDKTERYALIANKRASVEEFLHYAETHRIGVETVNSTQEFPELLTEAPPCLVTLANGGIPEGQRNNTLFSLAVYARKRWPADWQEHVTELNANFVSPPLTNDEVKEVVRHVDKKDYNYPCKQEPICSVCQKSVCKNRKYGVTAHQQVGTFGLEFTNVVRLEVNPVVYFADFAGKRIEFGSKHLSQQGLMRQLLIEQTNSQPQRMSGPAYDAWANAMMGSALIVDAPVQTGNGQQIMYALSKYCSMEAPNRKWRDILKGGSRVEEGRVYFDPSAFVAHVNSKTRMTLTESELWKALLMHDVRAEEKADNGTAMRFWCVPEGVIATFYEKEAHGHEEDL